MPRGPQSRTRRLRAARQPGNGPEAGSTVRHQDGARPLGPKTAANRHSAYADSRAGKKRDAGGAQPGHKVLYIIFYLTGYVKVFARIFLSAYCGQRQRDCLEISRACAAAEPESSGILRSRASLLQKPGTGFSGPAMVRAKPTLVQGCDAAVPARAACCAAGSVRGVAPECGHCA